MRPISTSIITVITCYVIHKVIVDGLLRPKSISAFITTWVMGEMLADLIPLSTSSITINDCSRIDRERLYGLLRHIYAISNVNTLITNVINSMILMLISFEIQIHIFCHLQTFQTHIIRNITLIKIVGGLIDGLLRPISKTSITTYTKNFIVVPVEIKYKIDIFLMF